MFRLTQFLRQSSSSLWKLSAKPWTTRNSTSGIKANLHRVSKLEKRALVWTGKYKSIADVPDVLTIEVVDRAKNKLRIRIANIMIVLTLVGCVAVSISGKRAHERGESISQSNLEWHKSIEK